MSRAVGPEDLEPHRRHLWGLGYRMTGSAADADDLVQEAFVRAIERPPPDLARDLRPWLTKVTLNLGRDALRRRRARSYVGPWLPAPIETGEEPGSAEAHLADDETTAGRYDLLESVSLAFLVALEALVPRERAVLLLRDVFDHTAVETAGMLDLSVSNVKVTLHRARKKLDGYDRARRTPSPELDAATTQALSRMMAALGRRDHDAVAALLAEEAAAFTDGGGVFFAATRVVRGRVPVAKLLLGIADRSEISGLTARVLNGRPALEVTFAPRGPRDAPRAILTCDVGADDRVTRIYSVLAPDKLRGLAGC